MAKFSHLFLLCGLQILPSLALSSVTSSTVIKLGTTRNSTKGNVTESKTYNESSNNLAQNTTGIINTSAYSVNNTTSPAIHHSTNVTNPDTTQKSGVPSPAATTINTTVDYNMSTTITSLVIDKSTGIQSTSEPTATLTTTSMTLSSPTTTAIVSSLSTTNTTPAYLTTKMTLDNHTNNETTGPGLNHSEKSMTILFSMVLGVIVLIVLAQFVYKVIRSKQRSVQYSHRPLYNDDAGDQSGVPDDTLVISGGLYDGPQIYNPTVTTLNDEDQPTFSYTPTQFCLELLHDDQQADHEQQATASELQHG
ncbi:uncharacterized protein LOC143521393 isoform X2 [Brachyhypopomus gauderio]|uniref:uncharacterized protein LOC143521393 isoform X2 n=1 Tax=Brachyhypopomus gauderio TaxID=698409 RepID=UPI004042B014